MTCRVCYTATEAGAVECPNGHTLVSAPCAPPPCTFAREDVGVRSPESRAGASVSTPPRASASARDSGERQAATDVRDPYAVLGVPKSATNDEIRDAFTTSAKRWHPDRPTGNSLRFREAAFARDILLDPNRRAMFDRYGAASFAQGFQPPMAVELPKIQIPTDRIETVEAVGAAAIRAAAYLKTPEGQAMAVQGMKAVAKLQTPEGVAAAKGAFVNGLLNFLAAE